MKEVVLWNWQDDLKGNHTKEEWQFCCKLLTAKETTQADDHYFSLKFQTALLNIYLVSRIIPTVLWISFHHLSYSTSILQIRMDERINERKIKRRFTPCSVTAFLLQELNIMFTGQRISYPIVIRLNYSDVLLAVFYGRLRHILFHIHNIIGLETTVHNIIGSGMSWRITNEGLISYSMLKYTMYK